MPTINATPKHTAANAYLTLAEAETYFAARLNVAPWTAAADAQKEQALITATTRLDEETYQGTKTTVEQALKWPRFGTYDDNNDHYDQDVVPGIIKDSTCELALAMLASDLLASTGLEGFEEVQVGPLRVRPRVTTAAGILPEVVTRKLRPVLTTPSRSNARLVRG